MQAIEIDGSLGEAGGQIIRTSLSLAAVTGKKVKITNIRARRSKPGLQAQHLTACKAVRSICRGTLEGAEIGSRELVFTPGEIVGGKYDFRIGTAGSVTLVAQAVLPILLIARKPSNVTIEGGTHVMKSPCFDYFENVFLPAISLMGAEVEAGMLKPGFFPKGGGKITLDVQPSRLKGVEVWPAGDAERAIVRVSDLPLSIAMREKKIFIQAGVEKVFIRDEKALDKGNAVTAWKGLKGSYSLGKIGKRAETVAKEALDDLRAEQGDVDMHLADQLLIYAAMAEGKTFFRTSRITQHFTTNSTIIRKFLDREIEAGSQEATVL